MEQIKKAFKRAVAGEDPFETIFYSNPQQSTFEEAAHKYQLMTEPEK